MNKLLQYSALAMFVAAGAANVAHADDATTSGGLKIKTSDGKFEFGIGGRIQVDGVIFDDDRIADVANAGVTNSGVYVRRSYLTLTGKLYDWKFKFENDFTANGAGAAGGTSIREMWVAHPLLGGELTIGQRKPFRSIEELTSSQEILLLERPFLTNVLLASGGRQYQPGLFYQYPITTPFGYFLLQASAYNAGHQIGTAAGQGFGFSNRVAWLAYDANDIKVHVGLWGGEDNFGQGGSATLGAASVAYAGRNSATNVTGPTQVIAPATSSSEAFYGAELAGTFGSAFIQSEYGRTRFEDASGGQLIDEVNSWNVQGSYFLTGEKKVYKKDRGTFGTPKVNKPWGAVELTARYDKIVNENRAASTGTGVCQASAALVAGRIGEGCYVQQYTVGANYYFNPAVRLMFNYVRGDNNVTGDNTASYNVRVQLGF